jgi:hypothetical protein
LINFTLNILLIFVKFRNQARTWGSDGWYKEKCQ